MNKNDKTFHITETLTKRVISLQVETGCWNVLKPGDKHYPEFNYYVPNYKSTLWTLIFLADIGARDHTDRFTAPLNVIKEHFFDPSNGIFTMGKSHFPIPCLNGNMLYLLSYFGLDSQEIVDSVIDFFLKYQRFDDGDFKTPASYPYFSNKSCYGCHTCYWGVVKLFKGLSFIPKEKRSNAASLLLRKCIDFVKLHRVCYSSRRKEEYIHKRIQYISFPNMYHSDFLEILWILSREGEISKDFSDAIRLLKEKRGADGKWKIEKTVKNLIIPFGKAEGTDSYVTKRAMDVLRYYDNL